MRKDDGSSEIPVIAPLRVCHVSTVHQEADVRILHRECGTLAQLGYDVHLVIPAEESRVVNGVQLHGIRRMRRRPLRMLIMPWVALGVVVRLRPAIVHYHDPELILMGFVLRWVFRKHVVYDIHEDIPRQMMFKEYLPGWTKKMAGRVYRMVERVFRTGQALVLANESCVPMYPPSAVLVRNYPLLKELPDASTVGRSDAGDENLLIYVGGVSEDRGGLMYIRLAHALKEHGYRVRTTIIGRYTGRFGERMQALVEELGVGDVVSIAGHMEYGAAMSLVRQASIGLCLMMPLPGFFRREPAYTLPTKILEYMIYGLPVLASDFDVWRPYVEGIQSGVMVNPCDFDDVVRGCERMLRDPAELAAMGRRGMEAVRQRFNWESELQSLHRCYQRLLSRD